MRFALLGDAPAGMALAEALLAGRHELLACTSPRLAAWRQRLAPTARQVADLEEILADPQIELIIVASDLRVRAEHLKRALQSERPVACVHPVAHHLAVAYEAAMIEQETRQVLLSLQPDFLHPALARLREFIARPGHSSPLGEFRLLEIDYWSPGETLLLPASPGDRPAFPSWDVLRFLGGEIAEITAFAAEETTDPAQVVLLAGRWLWSGLFRASFVPRNSQPRLRYRVLASQGQAELLFPEGPGGSTILTWHGPDGEIHEEYWEVYNPWPEVAAGLVRAVEAHAAGQRLAIPGLSWQDAIRSHELDDAAWRSLERRRSVVLEYPEASEEVTFKGTMTLVGCALLWAVIFLAILSRWIPYLGWGVVPLLVVFLLLQLLRWIIPPRDPTTSPAPEERKP